VGLKLARGSAHTLGSMASLPVECTSVDSTRHSAGHRVLRGHGTGDRPTTITKRQALPHLFTTTMEPLLPKNQCRADSAPPVKRPKKKKPPNRFRLFAKLPLDLQGYVFRVMDSGTAVSFTYTCKSFYHLFHRGASSCPCQPPPPPLAHDHPFATAAKRRLLEAWKAGCDAVGDRNGVVAGQLMTLLCNLPIPYANHLFAAHPLPKISTVVVVAKLREFPGRHPSALLWWLTHGAGTFHHLHLKPSEVQGLRVAMEQPKSTTHFDALWTKILNVFRATTDPHLLAQAKRAGVLERPLSVQVSTQLVGTFCWLLARRRPPPAPRRKHARSS
jgi:hypothetical protein